MPSHVTEPGPSKSLGCTTLATSAGRKYRAHLMPLITLPVTQHINPSTSTSHNGVVSSFLNSSTQLWAPRKEPSPLRRNNEHDGEAEIAAHRGASLTTSYRCQYRQPTGYHRAGNTSILFIKLFPSPAYSDDRFGNLPVFSTPHEATSKHSCL